MSGRLSRLARWRAVCFGLWLAPGALLAVPAFAVTLGSPLDEAGRLADLARDKDIVWLALCMTILAIGFSAWLVRRSFALWEESITEIRNFRLEMIQRPCVQARAIQPPISSHAPPSS